MTDLKEINDCLKAVEKVLLGEFGSIANIMQS